MSRPVLVTGAAGFIGAAVCERLLSRGERVVGIDNLNSYYDPALKQDRLSRIEASAPKAAWKFHRLELEDGSAMAALFARERPRLVIHLAAQAGGALFPGKSWGLLAEQLGGFWRNPRRLPPTRR